MIRQTGPLLGVVVTAITLLLIGACGSNDPTSTTTPPPGEVSPSPTATPIPTPTLEDSPPTATSIPTPTDETSVPPEADGALAPELVGTQEWINSAPLKLEELRGQVVLIDFWTYTRVNCIRIFPYLKIWHSKYADDGLVIIGVHTPEFRFEHELENVQEAVIDYSIGWPVVQDNDYQTWQAYDNRGWPAKYLIDKDGVIRYGHLGEGAYDETEHWIRNLLEEAGADLSIVEPLPSP